MMKKPELAREKQLWCIYNHKQRKQYSFLCFFVYHIENSKGVWYNNVRKRLIMNIRFGTGLIIFVNVAVYIYMMILFGTTTDPDVLVYSGAMYGPAFDWADLITANFIHIGFAHLLSNMLSVLILGPMLEEYLGTIRYLAIYLLSGVIACIGIYYFANDTVTAGASTAIFGLMGALAALVLTKRDHFKQHLEFAIVIIGYNLYATFQPGISIPAHIGGLVVGFTLTLLATLRREN